MTDPTLESAYAFEALFASSLFTGAPVPLLLSTVAGCETRDLSAGEHLLTAGQTNQVLYLVLSGRLSVHVPGTGRAHVQVGRGECVGELSLIDGLQVSADVVADEETVVVAIEREQLWSLLEASSQVARNLLRILAGRVRYDDRMLGESDRRERQFEEAATVDALTGLRNRRWLDEAFARQLDRSARTGRPLSILMIDVDHFKRINDAHGHPVGDQVLFHVGRTLASCLRPQDLLARFGGEEFAVLLPGVGGESAVAVGERLRGAVEQAHAVVERATGAMAVPLTVSIGVATTSSEGPVTVGHLIKRADEALYRAKHGGRNCVRR
ncbi:MAG: GGDEF domain-containing protein [Vicinamibacterales bacterium]